MTDTTITAAELRAKLNADVTKALADPRCDNATTWIAQLDADASEAIAALEAAEQQIAELRERCAAAEREAALWKTTCDAHVVEIGDWEQRTAELERQLAERADA